MMGAYAGLLRAAEEFFDGADRVVVIRERDRHDAQRVVGELAVGARQFVERDERVRLLFLQHGAVEHAREGLQAFIVQAQLEQRPALFVEALREEGRLVALADDVFVGALGRAVVPRGEQQLAAAELHFVELRRLRIVA